MSNEIVCTIKGQTIIARKGRMVTNDPTEPPYCPDCKTRAAKRKAVLDIIQYGFFDDEQKTVFRCKCGAFYWVAFDIPHHNLDFSDVTE